MQVWDWLEDGVDSVKGSIDEKRLCNRVREPQEVETSRGKLGRVKAI